MKRFLFVFGYESPIEQRSNRDNGTDFESSNAVWIRASSQEEATLRGRRYADEFVAKLYRDAKSPETRRWSEQDFAHWIAKNPADEFSGLALETFEEIGEHGSGQAAQ